MDIAWGKRPVLFPFHIKLFLSVPSSLFNRWSLQKLVIQFREMGGSTYSLQKKSKVSEVGGVCE
jgi:hypothetical protein